MPSAASWVIVCVLVGSFGPQDRPNFSGKWTGRQAMANLFGVTGPEDMTITQDASVIRIDRLFSRNHVSIVVNLDGTPSTNVLDPGPIRPGAISVVRKLISIASWESGKLKIATMGTLPGTNDEVQTIEILSFKDEDLVVERIDEVFGNSQDSLRPQMFKTTKLIYKKKSGNTRFNAGRLH